jgi:glycosyltransferase involved in cell wall biosynthesis
MKIAIAIATTGRPGIVGEALARFMRLDRKADRLLVVGASQSDAPTEPHDAGFAISPTKGSSAQRNHALDLIGDDADVIVFVDDDFAPAPGFLEGVERLFAEHADIVAASGELIADGATRGGYTFEQADAFISAWRTPIVEQLRDSSGAYGCNMAYRRASAPHLRFDENLPLYGWLEDTDFSARYARFGRVVRCNHFAGVHLGVRSGRVSGVRLGYSQIANPLYLLRKGTAAPSFALTLAARNMLSNTVKSIRPEPDIDRRGRLRGNLLALADVLRGRADPRRILEL